LASGIPLRSNDDAHIQRVLDGLVGDGAPGALARFQVGQRLWAGSSGIAELGRPEPVAPQGWFRIGSVTKVFTCTVLLQLIGEGVLHLDDTVTDWLPDLVPAGDQITLRHLVRHTSGLYNYTDDLLSDRAALLRNRFNHHSPQEIVAQATRRPPLFAPGTSSRSYSNTNYILLGMVIEKATSSSYRAEIERRIQRPVGLRHTLVPRHDPALPEPHAHGYLPVDGQLVDITEFNASAAWAAGGIISTAEDLNLFYTALLAGQLLNPDEMQAMQNTVPTDSPEMEAGLGIARVRLPDGVTVWGNGGGFFGYHTWSFHTAAAQRQLTISTTTAHGGRPPTTELLARVFCPPTGHE
jgi:D-alanyl-D-alanine carboxypeptidase